MIEQRVVIIRATVIEADAVITFFIDADMFPN
jgi:hypothetical protein